MYDEEKDIEDYANRHYKGQLNNLNKTNQLVLLNRLPTLGEILANKTKLPVDFFTFYSFMRDVEGKVDYIDFWIDLIQHLNLCKHYVQGLRDLIIRQSAHNEHTQLTGDDNGTNPRNLRLSRGLIPLSEPLKHKLLLSLILLELIINDNILEDNDSNRLSQFLRGDISLENLDPKLKDVIHQYNKHHLTGLNRSLQLPLALPIAPYEFSQKRLLLQLRLLDDNDQSFNQTQAARKSMDFPTPPRRLLAINPLLLEKLIHDSPNDSVARDLFVTRENLKELSHNLLLKYFVEDSEKNLNLPQSMHDDIIRAINVEGRDDPDVFKQVKEYVFNRMESDHLPKFLNFTAIRNVNHSNFIRVVLGFFFLFAGFWIGFTLIFLNYSKGIRAVCVAPFFIAFYFLVTSIVLVDPLLAWFGYTELFTRRLGLALRKVREPFVYRLLVKRSLWVMVYILVCTAILLVVFLVVPSTRL